MPQQLHSVYPNSSARCWKSPSEPAGFSHIFWECPQIQSYWQEVAQYITTLTAIPISMRIGVGFLGLVDSLAFARGSRILLGLLLFYASEAIVLKWKSDRAPTLSFSL